MPPHCMAMHGSHCLCWRIAARNAAGIAPSHLLWLCFACRAAALLFVLVVSYCPAVTSPPFSNLLPGKRGGGVTMSTYAFASQLPPPAKGILPLVTLLTSPIPGTAEVAARALSHLVCDAAVCAPPLNSCTEINKALLCGTIRELLRSTCQLLATYIFFFF